MNATKKIVLLQTPGAELSFPREIQILETSSALIVGSAKAGSSLTKAEVVDVQYQTDFHKRNQGIVDPSCLKEVTVLVIGAGSVGSKFVLAMTRSGVEKFIVIEPDTVETPNICRCAYLVADIGDPKAEALKSRVLEINPLALVEVHKISTFDMSRDDFASLVGRADLIVEATDSPQSKVYLNSLAYHRKPVIYPSIYDGGKGGEIILTVPSATPCYECVMEEILPHMDAVQRGDWDYSTGQAKPMAGLNAHIDIVVARTCMLAVAVILEGSGVSSLERIVPSGCSVLFIGNERDFFVFEEPFQEIWATSEFDPNCTCRSRVTSIQEENRAQPATLPERPSSDRHSEGEPAHDESGRQALVLQPEENV